MRRFWAETRIPETRVPSASIFTTFPTWSWQKKHKKGKLMYRVAKYSLEWEEWVMMKCVENWNGWTLHRHVSFWHDLYKRGPPTTCIKSWKYIAENSNVQHYLLVLMAENSWATRGIFMILEFHVKFKLQKFVF